MRRSLAALTLFCGALLTGCDEGVQQQLENEMILMQERLVELETQVGDSQAQAVRVTAIVTELQAQIRDLEAEIIDLRTLWPWDRDRVMASVEKTKRLLVVQEAVSVAGFGAEIAASVAEALHPLLAAPVKRLGAPRVPVSYAPTLENQVRVTAEAIVAAAQSQLAPAAA